MPEPDSTPTRCSRSTPEAEDEVIQAAYRRLARKYHPDLAADAEAAARMVGDQRGLGADRRARRARRLRPGAEGRGRRRCRRRAERDGPGRPVRAADAGGAPTPPEAARAPASAPSGSPRPPETVSRDWTSGRSTRAAGSTRRCARPEGLGAAGPPPGRPVGQRAQLRALQRLVAGRDRPPRHRVHRVAGSHADRPEVPRRDRRDPAGRRSSQLGGHVGRPPRALPPTLGDGGDRRHIATAGSERRRRRSIWPATSWQPPPRTPGTPERDRVARPPGQVGDDDVGRRSDDRGVAAEAGTQRQRPPQRLGGEPGRASCSTTGIIVAV